MTTAELDIGERSTGRLQVRDHLIAVTSELLRDHNPEAVTTRAVAAAAGLQPPTIYRLFGDKDGLLDAVAEQVYADYAGGKTIDETSGPLDEFHAGWRLHIGFGLANPGVFALMADPRRAAHSRAAATGRRMLLARVGRIAAVGLLRVSQQHAAELTHAVATGTILTLLATPADHRDLALSETAYRAVVDAITVESSVLSEPGPVGAAVALRASAAELTALSPGERLVLTEWLDRITAAPSESATAKSAAATQAETAIRVD